MPTDDESSTHPAIPDDALLLLNRATLVTHTVRTAVHELNNVLQMIGGSAELIASAGVPAAASARLETILKQVMRGHVILQSVARVGEVAADDIPPTSHSVPLTNVYRDDEPRPCLTQEEALAGAPDVYEGRFRVPRILDEEV